jgi:hypothetical protein
MAVYNVTRSVDIAVAENTLKRDVDESMLKLEPDAAPLWVLTNNAKKRAPAIAPKFEWFEDAEAPLWGQVSNSTDYSSIATTILVVDSTIFAVDDLIIVPTPTGAGKSAVDEVMLCTGSAGNSITVTRALGGTGTNQTLTSAAGLRILGQACVEGGGVPTVRTTAKVNHTSACQYFRTPIKTTEIMEATEAYSVPEGERMYQRGVALVRHRSEIEAAGLWGQFSETLAVAGSRWSTQGVKATIQTNITDASTTLTYSAMLQFGEMGFRFGEKQKLCMAGPHVLSAFDYFSANKILTAVSDTVFGVAIKKIVSNHGTYMIANNFRMEAGIAGAAGFNDELYLIDLPSVSYRYLAGNGKNLNTKLYENVVQSGTAATVDEYRSMAGWQVRFEKKHGRMYNATAFA